MCQQNRESLYQEEEHDFSEGEIVMQRKTPDDGEEKLLSTNTSFVYASNESLDREYLLNAQASNDVYDEIPKRRTKSPTKLQTSLNSTISASNFITPEKLMEKLDMKSKGQQQQQQIPPRIQQKNSSRPKKKTLKKSSQKERTGQVHDSSKQEHKQNKQMQQQSSSGHPMNERSSQTFVSTSVLRKSPSKDSYTQVNIPFSSDDRQHHLHASAPPPSLSHLSTSKDAESRFLMSVLKEEEAFTAVEKYDKLHEVYLQRLASAVEILTYMTAVGIGVTLSVFFVHFLIFFRVSGS